MSKNLYLNTEISNLINRNEYYNMIICNYNIEERYVKYILWLVLLVVICSTIVAVVGSFFVLKYIRSEFDDHGVFFNHYNKKSQQVLDKYGDFKINNLYLVRIPLTKLAMLAINLGTCYTLNEYIKLSPVEFPYHSVLICEIKIKNKYGKKRKLFMIEKNNCVSINDSFAISHNWDMLKINIQPNYFSLNSILNDTRSRIGDAKFFNWNLFTNNCNALSKEILITIDKFTPNIRKFICRDHLIHSLATPTDFTIHLLNCYHIRTNICQTYVFDNLIL